VRGVFLLLPFLLGFSTTLVMTVLNRMVTGVETVFGIDRGELRRMPRPAKPPRLLREADVSDHHPLGQSEVVTRLSAERSGRPGPV
jgi:hypothetical protein